MADGKGGAIQKHRVTKKDIYNSITRMMRDPFRNELVKVLTASPNKKAIKEFASKYPDRWAQTVAILARLSGFNEQIEVLKDVHIELKIKTMSDSELEDEIKGLVDAVDVEVQEVRK